MNSYKMTVGAVSLGCDKNRMDTENMLAYLVENGYTITSDPSDAEVIIVNTCGFIDSAKREAIATIFEMAEYKKDKCKYLVVTGCLSQRYMDELKDQMPEVDVFLGTSSYQKLPSILDGIEFQKGQLCIKNSINDRVFTTKRVQTTPQHYAYLKIAEGCDNRCTYCAIPSIRGKYTSRSIEEIIEEAKILESNNVQEIILVAQDVSRYGIDLYGEVKLIDLLEELNKLNFKWIRLLYLYPEQITNELLQYMVSHEKICKYLDIPLQHVDNMILKRMNRNITNEYIVDLLNRIRSYGDFTIRTTFIVGFPGETENQFNELCEFIKLAKFDRCGFFAYSCEEGTAASRLPNQLTEEIKETRVAKLYEIQENIMQEKLESRIGQTLDVIYEDIDYDKQLFVGRSVNDAPEIDTLVYFKSKLPVDVGNIYKVKINKIIDKNSYGEIE